MADEFSQYVETTPARPDRLDNGFNGIPPFRNVWIALDDLFQGLEVLRSHGYRSRSLEGPWMAVSDRHPTHARGLKAFSIPTMAGAS